MEKNKILITVEGGIVQQIFSTNENTEVLLVDFDSEGADSDEFLTEEEIKTFTKNENFKEPKLISGIYDKDFDI